MTRQRRRRERRRRIGRRPYVVERYGLEPQGSVGRGGETSYEGLEQSGKRGQQTLRQEYDNHDERDTDHQLPQKRQRSRKVGRGDVDAHGAENRSDQRGATAERRPDQQLRSEQEPAELGGDHVREGGVPEPGRRGNRTGDDHENDLDPAHRNAEVGATLLVLADCHQQTADIAAHEQVAR